MQECPAQIRENLRARASLTRSRLSIKRGNIKGLTRKGDSSNRPGSVGRPYEEAASCTRETSHVGSLRARTRTAAPRRTSANANSIAQEARTRSSRNRSQNSLPSASSRRTHSLAAAARTRPNFRAAFSVCSAAKAHAAADRPASTDRRHNTSKGGYAARQGGPGEGGVHEAGRAQRRQTFVTASSCRETRSAQKDNVVQAEKQGPRNNRNWRN